MSTNTVQKNDTMWPEKIDAIYEQFTWLELVVKRVLINRAFVKRFDEDTLDIINRCRVNEGGGYCCPYNQIWFVDHHGEITYKLGIGIHKGKDWVFFGKEVQTEYIKAVESVRSVIKNCSVKDASFVVEFENGQLTIFKPPHKDLTIKEWYDIRVKLIKEEVAQQVASA